MKLLSALLLCVAMLLAGCSEPQRFISAWNLSDDAHQSSVLRISTLAVTNTPMPAEWRA